MHVTFGFANRTYQNSRSGGLGPWVYLCVGSKQSNDRVQKELLICIPEAIQREDVGSRGSTLRQPGKVD